MKRLLCAVVLVLPLGVDWIQTNVERSTTHRPLVAAFSRAARNFVNDCNRDEQSSDAKFYSVGSHRNSSSHAVFLFGGMSASS
jgi:hypothetical protein